MTQPAPKIEADTLERAVDNAIVVCDGDLRAALRAALIYNEFLERKIDMMRAWSLAGTPAAKSGACGKRKD